MNGLAKFAAGAAAVVALSAGMGVGAAEASTWVLSYTADNAGDTPSSATLDLTASDILNAAGGFDILSLSGSVDGDTVDKLSINPSPGAVSYSPDGLFIFDNTLWTSGAAPALSNPGLLFTGVSGHEYNLFSDDMTHYELYQATPGYTEHSYGTISLHESFERGPLGALGGAVPEPASWALMILGFGGVGAVLRRRREATRAFA